MDPDRNYDIHFELKYHITTNELHVYLHYETSPYMPKKEALESIEIDGYTKYCSRRERFIAYIKVQSIKGFRVGGRCNQIGIFDIPIIEDTRLGDFKYQLAPIIEKLTDVIDCFGDK